MTEKRRILELPPFSCIIEDDDEDGPDTHIAPDQAFDLAGMQQSFVDMHTVLIDHLREERDDDETLWEAIEAHPNPTFEEYLGWLRHDVEEALQYGAASWAARRMRVLLGEALAQLSDEDRSSWFRLVTDEPSRDGYDTARALVAASS